MSYTTILGIIALVFIYIVIVQVSKSIEFMQAIKDKERNYAKDTTSNRVNAWLMIVFLVIGMLSVFWFHNKYQDKILEPSSVEGEAYDKILLITFVITGVVFLVTQTLLFIFAFKYRAKDNRLGFYYPHNSKLEILWTVIPSLGMCIMVITGLKYWTKATGDAPQGSETVEITGKQYEWIFRYPGKDGVLGKKYYKKINDADNRLGQLWEDKANHDDIITSELHLVVGKPVEILIASRDVVHSVGLPHFRMMADAVPGLPTRMWFTPKYTTKEMQSKTSNPDFEYEIVCDQMCGSGHYGMRGAVVVETQEEYDAWLKAQKSYYERMMAEKKAEQTASLEK